MEQHSQLSKASRLRQQYAHLRGLGLEGVNENMDAALLLLLFGLANKPLQRGKVLAQEGAAQAGSSPAEAAALDALAASESSSGSEGEEDGVSSSWDSGSQLSDWEGEEGEVHGGEESRGMSNKFHAQQHQQEAQSGSEVRPLGAAPTLTTTAPPSEPTPAPPPGTPEALPPPRPRATATTAPKHSASAAGRLHMPAFPPMPAAQAAAPGLAQPIGLGPLSIARQDDLVPCLVRTRLQALPFIAPPPQKRLSDKYITHQVSGACSFQGAAQG